MRKEIAKRKRMQLLVQSPERDRKGSDKEHREIGYSGQRKNLSFVVVVFTSLLQYKCFTMLC